MINDRSLVFAPGCWSRYWFPEFSLKSTSIDELMPAFRSLANLNHLHVEIRHGFIMKSRARFLKAHPALFPEVTTLTVSVSSIFMLKHCPKAHTLVLRNCRELCFGQRDALSSPDVNVPINFGNKMWTLPDFTKALPKNDSQITTVVVAANFARCFPSMLRGKKRPVTSRTSVVTLCNSYFNRSTVDRGFTDTLSGSTYARGTVFSCIRIWR